MGKKSPNTPVEKIHKQQQNHHHQQQIQPPVAIPPVFLGVSARANPPSWMNAEWKRWCHKRRAVSYVHEEQFFVERRYICKPVASLASKQLNFFSDRFIQCWSQVCNFFKKSFTHEFPRTFNPQKPILFHSIPFLPCCFRRCLETTSGLSSSILAGNFSHTCRLASPEGWGESSQPMLEH